MNFKENLICNICNKILDDPVYLPCHCYVCNKHMSSRENTIKCLKCIEEFPKSKRFKPNEFVKQFIDSDLHLTEEQKSTKQSVTKMLLEFETLLQEFKSNEANFHTNIIEKFDQIRNKIDLQREELKKRIDEIALEMIDQINRKENTLIKNLNSENLNIINNSVGEESRRLLEEFRNPNMILENIKISLGKQESTIKQFKSNMHDFKFKVDQSKLFYFKPNLNNENKIFGVLNLATRLISCSYDKTIKIWDLETLKCLQTLNGHSDSVCQVEKFTNNQILSCSRDKTIKLWDIDLGLCLKTFNQYYAVCCLKILSNKTFASGSNKVIEIWNIYDGMCIRTLKGHSDWIRDLLLLPNGSLVSCSQDQTINVWNIELGVCTKTLNGHTLAVYCLLLLNSGNLASGSKDTTIKIWELESGNCITTLIGHTDWVWSLKLKQSGELISASSDKTIKIWDLETCTCIKTLIGHNAGITFIRTYQNNQLVSSSADKTIKLWNLETLSCIKTLAGHTDAVNYLAFL